MSVGAHDPKRSGSIATAKLSRLSLLREGLGSLDSKNPQPAPAERAATFRNVGRTISHTPPPAFLGAWAERQPRREGNGHARKRRLKERDNQNSRFGRADDLALETAADIRADEGRRNAADKAPPVHRRLRDRPARAGRMSSPAMIRPLTLGSRSSFVTRVMSNPAKI